MTEFLTENARRSYPLEGEWPDALRDRWSGTLVDACVYASSELGEARVSLLYVRRLAGSLEFTVGVPDVPGVVQLVVPVPSGLGGFTTVYAGNESLKAILTVDGKAVDALALDGRYTVNTLSVGVPFAARCAGGAERNVTSLSVIGTASGTTPLYGSVDPGMVEKSVVAGEHAVLKAYDGVDLEVAGTVSRMRDVLRVSAIAAPEAPEAEEETVDIMIRGDACFTVDAEPGPDGSTGTIRINNVCKPCCQCEDYGAAVAMLKPAEARTWELNAELDRVEALYRSALARFEQAKKDIADAVNSPAHVHVSATVAASGGIYGQSTAKGTRCRLSVTLLVENMTTATASVSVDEDGVNSGFRVPGYTHHSTTWAKAAHGGVQRGNYRPGTQSLEPGETLSVTAVYVKEGTGTNDATPPAGMKAYCAVTVGGKSATKTVQITAEEVSGQ